MEETFTLNLYVLEQCPKIFHIASGLWILCPVLGSLRYDFKNIEKYLENRAQGWAGNPVQLAACFCRVLELRLIYIFKWLEKKLKEE